MEINSEWYGNHLSPSSTEVKNEWSYNSTPSECLHGMSMEYFSVYFIHSFNYSLCNDVRLYNKWMIRWKSTVNGTGCEREQFQSVYDVVSQHLSGGTQGKHKKRQV
jgi:hypothetical protein